MDQSQIKDIIIQNKTLLLPPDIPDEAVLKATLDLNNFGIYKEEDDILAFIHWLQVHDGIKEISMMYNKQNNVLGGLFILEEIYKQLSMGNRVLGTTWEHNNKMETIARKVCDIIEDGYCWTIYDDTIVNKQPSSSFTVAHKDYVLYYNGIYFSVDLINYNYGIRNLKALMRDYETNRLVVFSPVPNIRLKMYKYKIYDVDIVRLSKYVDMYRKLSRKAAI
ncbi:MAG: hypothetical protein ACP5MB_05010 [bacterium]